MRMIPMMLVAAVMVVTGVQAGAKPRETGEAALAKEIEGRVPGKPVNCLFLRDIRSTRIIDGTAIIYESSGNLLYVNRPASGASSLNRNDVLVTSTSISQLCNVDIVRLYDMASRFQRGSVGLGDFVPYKKVKPAPAG